MPRMRHLEPAPDLAAVGFPEPGSPRRNLWHKAKVHRTYVARLERGESGVTVEALAAILAALGVSLREFFKPFKEVVRPRTPSRRVRRAWQSNSAWVGPPLVDVPRLAWRRLTCRHELRAEARRPMLKLQLNACSAEAGLDTEPMASAGKAPASRGTACDLSRTRPSAAAQSARGNRPVLGLSFGPDRAVPAR